MSNMTELARINLVNTQSTLRAETHLSWMADMFAGKGHLTLLLCFVKDFHSFFSIPNSFSPLSLSLSLALLSHRQKLILCKCPLMLMFEGWHRPYLHMAAHSASETAWHFDPGQVAKGTAPPLPLPSPLKHTHTPKKGEKNQALPWQQQHWSVLMCCIIPN